VKETEAHSCSHLHPHLLLVTNGDVPCVKVALRLGF